MYIRCAHNGKPPEWTLLELQGGLTPTVSQSALTSLNIGKIVNVEGETHTLTIGKHQLEGRLVSIKKPFAVLKKRCAPEGEESDSACYDVIGVIRQKLHFKSRPKPLVA